MTNTTNNPTLFRLPYPRRRFSLVLDRELFTLATLAGLATTVLALAMACGS